MDAFHIDRDEIFISIARSNRLYKFRNQIGIHDLLPYANASPQGLYSPFIYQDPNYEMGRGCIVVEDWISREKYFLRSVGSNQDGIRRYFKIIFDKIPTYNGLWPVDIVILTPGQSNMIRDRVERMYDDAAPFEQKSCKYALVFPYDNIPEVESISSWISKVGEISHRERRIRCLAVKIVKTIEILNNANYYLFDMHFSRFFVNRKDTSIFLDFTELILHKNETMLAELKHYPLEFAYPTLTTNKEKRFSYRKQNYSLAAMLFYLLINAYAHDSTFVEKFTDNDITSHYTKVYWMAKTRKFIFDSDNDTLHGGVNGKTSEIWDELPSILRNAFESSLSYGTEPKRIDTKHIPCPHEWLELFDEMGWCSC